ncbi:kanamycin nucleotidyltransferase C-terminal domain-containing protein [Paenibacillus dokdonensis]|uniref:Kanamycin nucleotidyltransferase C-terminal domain-containing protein n=2 Tax=Paenibacillus dokdonensis TaxID=2567944 RepID=A0ABU6GLC6_9BACL|nr:kanamycin nucleotidyltransferase C-terminal domain-containing protein [Paenibacillus dokdonensis]MEC0240164.1 kanamycin nucleotidyltransferase C-terminal domain-containing protein [Paenibacillus dokdonensis]
MLDYPAATTRTEKKDIIGQMKDRLLQIHGETILAIGLYGSIAQGIDGPYSDIEILVVTEDGISLSDYEFIYLPFKIEISMKQKHEVWQTASAVDDSWAIKAGVYAHLEAIYDPSGLVVQIQALSEQVSEEAIRETMRDFMIWEPYETMGKIRNNKIAGNDHYLPLGAKDLAWQTAKLIGIANRTFYNTRARTYEESLAMPSRPSGYDELIHLLMRGHLHDTELVYERCECLWSGLNEWYENMGIDYKVTEFPF